MIPPKVRADIMALRSEADRKANLASAGKRDPDAPKGMASRDRMIKYGGQRDIIDEILRIIDGETR